MQIMTKINDFEEIFFKSSIIFHIFARKKANRLPRSKRLAFFIVVGSLQTPKPRQAYLPENHPHQFPR